MSKTRRKIKRDFSFYEDYIVDHRKENRQESHRHSKRLTHALHTKNVDELLELEDDEELDG